MVYLGLMARFVVGRPTVTINYIAQVNRPTSAMPAGDRAWPLWRRALLGLTEWRSHDRRTLPAPFDDRSVGEPDPWPAQADWLRHHAADLGVAREAAARPALGFVIGPGGSEDAPPLFPTYAYRYRRVTGPAVVGEGLAVCSPPVLAKVQSFVLVGIDAIAVRGRVPTSASGG